MRRVRIGSLAKMMLGLCFIVFLAACNDSGSSAEALPDRRDSGTIHISVDESFKPVIDEQVKVYESNNPGAKIIVHYKPEAECLRDLGVDSIRMIITTRGLMADEKAFIRDSFKIEPKSMTVAYDAIAVIVNPASADSFFTMQELRDLLTAKVQQRLTPVFDGTRATSTVRFIIDSVLQGKSLGPHVVAAQNSPAVLDYVAKNKAAVGFIGVSWIGNPEDPDQLSTLKTVKMANIESADKPGAYIKPWRENIYYDRYPMVRDLVYVLKERHQGLGNAFANFMSGERGQLIFRRAYLRPGFHAFIIRPTSLNE
ncbi:MAG: PstS family phosphate ABC transporter substrate-binding protein [Chitinophagaceae bacterium]